MNTVVLASSLYLLAHLCFAPSSLILMVVLYRRVTNRTEFWSNVVHWRDDLDRNPFVRLNRFKTHKLPIISQEIRTFRATKFGKLVCRVWLCSLAASVVATVWIISLDITLGMNRH